MNLDKIKKIASALGIGLIGGLLGAWGGADGTSKAWRRILLPVVIAIYACFALKTWLGLALLGLIWVLTLGYGIPDATDDGSDIGAFWYNLFNGNHLLADYFTRGTIGALCVLALIWIPIINGAWLKYVWNGAGIITVFVTLSWRNMGTFKFLNKDLGWAEFITYATLTACAVGMM